MENDPGKTSACLNLRNALLLQEHRRRVLPTGLLALLLLLTGSARVASAQTTITASTTADDNTANGTCTLREALIAANTDTAVDACPAGNGADIIELSGATYTLTLAGAVEDAAATGDLDVTSSVTIRGAGPGATVIQAGTSSPVAGACADCVDRVFDVRGGGILALEHLTVRHGSLASAHGGGIRVVSGSTLTVLDCTITNNLAYAATGAGGGIYNESGTVTIRQSTISGNKSEQDKGGGVGNVGSSAVMEIENSTISDNIAGSAGSDHGGGIHNAAGATLTITNSTLSGNNAGDNGGGIYATSSTLTITNSTLSGNTAGDDGGGLFLSTGTYALTNSTLSGNNAGDSGSDNGGGIYDASSTNTVTLNNVTIAGNQAGDGASAALRINTSGAPLTLNNSILAGNVAPGGSPADQCNSATNIAGTHNLIDDATCGDVHRLGAVDADAFSPLLADNGGFTPTHALTDRGTATDGVDDGDAATCAAEGIDVDQRGIVRNGICDVGAFEAPAPPPPVNTPSVFISGTAGTGNDAGWRMMAPPAAGLTRDDLNGVTFASSSGDGDDLLLRYDESAGPWLTTTGSETLLQGTGFLLYLFDDTIDPIDPDLTISFSGAQETTGSVTTPELDTREHLHLLGNPFFTGFDLSYLNLVDQGFQATVQVWDPTAGGGAGSYRPITQGGSGDVIAMGQGFFAQRTSTSPGTTTLTFDSAGRVDGGDFVGKTPGSPSDRGEIRLALTGRSSDGTVVHDEAATVLFLDKTAEDGDAYEVVKLTPMTARYATVALEGTHQGEARALALASYPKALLQPLVIPLHLKGQAFAGALTLSWPVLHGIPAHWRLTLVDYQTGKQVDLRAVRTYTFAFEAPAGQALTRAERLTQPLPMATSQATARFALEINPLQATDPAEAAVPPALSLSQNYPNPFNPETLIRYSVPTAGAVRLVVYDVLGREVVRLIDGQQPAGTYAVRFDGTALPSGIYVYVLETASQRLHRTMFLVK